MATVRFSGVNKAYGTTSVVSDLDLELPDGSFTVLVGPSGCGKSTSLRMLAGLETVTSGSITIGARDVTHLQPRDRDIAMVFQNYALYPHLTVAENIAFPLRATKTPRREALTRAATIAESLGLAKLLDRKPKDLSGGQQQRVAIGRAIIREPSVFLFDEPLSNLDAKLRVETRTELLQIQRRLGITSVYVTHDQEEAMTLSDRMVVMRDGRIAQQGTPQEVYARPADTFVAAFVGSPKMNLIDGAVSGTTFTVGDGFALTVDQTAAGGPVTLGVRPDDLLPTVSDGDGAARVILIEHLGPRAIVTIDARGTELTSVVETSRLSGITEGTPVDLAVRPGATHFFDPATGSRLSG
ncbi:MULTISPECIES: ABC transporter ATP-binding protein [Mycolicibacterium]|jgi:multiple sugar transport system ATP-binding protein|uniref:Trehalose import ATP-binding protein SugC n=2 Tax=Mycolicibacterium TaxID=1866885 RepID=A1T8C9_MYCVP|nr:MULTISPECIES: sn-glycerol-3-phosphate ABC transporter ATP-binding protein UgpC [Mycolicibacterium]ABM13429.1 carbohydrate ABC transporter ATP-binding protein, CUT1 family [Mycolicibacterium vanbaalenii PYR-1]MCV7126895.1 sn-glycerol-3-phosphate ABC transporter ATP-binding protein UgpC [Mycolicibacterium vanbaalenii PYR-1]MDN4521755.1 sn-glycerol-3-phosphate ABC transporter ATP-binding protein UgpC [Mycolicibacterium austroafricanum]MDW5614683.1 sn-glycerol-3-phosphate ABC transporter ATP-bin